MAHVGNPIVGDPKYFNIENWEFPGGVQNKLHLLARRIAVPHPRGGIIDVTAPLPPHMEQSWNLLGFDAKRYDPIRGSSGGVAGGARGSYLRGAMRASLLSSVLVLPAAAAGPSFAQSGSGYSIMRRRLQHHGPRKGIKAVEARALACTEIQVATRHRGKDRHSALQDSAATSRGDAAAPLCARNWPNAAQSPDDFGLGTGWCRNLPGSCGALCASGRGLRTRRRPPQRLCRQLHQSVAILTIHLRIKGCS